MNFIKTQKLLTHQAGQTEIPLESVLELMRTYLTELRYHTNTSVDRCPIGNMSQTIANLAAVSNDILFVYRTNEQQIRAAESRYTQALAKAQKSCGDYHSRIALLDEQIRQSEADMNQLEQLQELEASRNAALRELHRKAETLQAQINAMRVTDPETEAARLQAQIENQTQELARLEAEFRARQQEAEGLADQLTQSAERLTRIRDDAQAEEVQLEALDRDIRAQEDRKNDLARQRGEAEQMLRQLSLSNDRIGQEQQALLEQINSISGALAQEQETRDSLQAQLAAKQAEVGTLQTQTEQALSLSRELENRHQALIQHNAQLQEQIAARELEIRQTTEAGGAVLDQLNALNLRQQQLEKDYADACQLQQQRQQEADELAEKLAQLDQRNTSVQEDIEAKAAEHSLLTATHRERSAQLSQLTADMEKLQEALQLMLEDMSRRRTEIAAAEEALKADQTEADTLLEQQIALNVALEAQRTDNQNFITVHLEPVKTMMAELVIQGRNDRAQYDELKNSISQLEETRATLSGKNNVLRLTLKSTQSKLDAVKADYDRNKQAVAVLEEDLRIKGSESAALLEKEKELRELLDEKNVARITAELESCNQRLEEDIRRAEQTEKTLAAKQRQLESLQQQLSVVQEELEACREKENKLQLSHKTAALELDRITGPENRKRCEQLHNQLQLMRTMTEQLTSHVLTPCGDSLNIPEHLRSSLDQAEQSILTLRQVIREYTAMRQNTLESSE